MRSASISTWKTVAIVAAASPGYHWTPARKEALLTQIRAGELSAEDAFETFGVTPEELESWALAYDQHGQRGLQVRRQVGRRI